MASLPAFVPAAAAAVAATGVRGSAAAPASGRGSRRPAAPPRPFCGAPVGRARPPLAAAACRGGAAAHRHRRHVTPTAGIADEREPMPLSPASVEAGLVEVREVLGTMFGSSAENRDIGITGDVSLVDVDGPFVTLRLSGRFWHKRTDVMSRVATYLQSRIPEIADVTVEHPDQLDEHAT